MTDEQQNSYWRLRPAKPTPDDETCHCPPGTDVILRDGLSDNPLACATCNGEVPPERLGFDPRLTEDIVFWLSAADSLLRLWLDSGEYESWAADRLLDPKGQVNAVGLEIVARLNAFNPAYYWWFSDPELTETQSPTHCPVCSVPFDKHPARGARMCAACRILM
jgi:Zn-ribbon-containing, possibly nucleic-acid-binding protein (DUF2310)